MRTTVGEVQGRYLGALARYLNSPEGATTSEGVRRALTKFDAAGNGWGPVTEAGQHGAIHALRETFGMWGGIPTVDDWKICSLVKTTPNNEVQITFYIAG